MEKWIPNQIQCSLLQHKINFQIELSVTTFEKKNSKYKTT